MQIELHLPDQSHDRRIAMESWVAAVAAKLNRSVHLTACGQVTIIRQPPTDETPSSNCDPGSFHAEITHQRL
ncbi:MAG: hypothetical protein NTW47_02715, partial [Proteobacteria bacterium]|nr:hypothetical protein [Pseudomonadota bacterium]